MNKLVFRKTLENCRKYKDTRLVITDKRRSYLLPELNYHIAKWFSGKLLRIEMNKSKVKMNKRIHLGLPISEIFKTVMYEFRCYYIKLKYQDKANLCYMDTNSLMVIKTANVHNDIVNDVGKKLTHQTMKWRDLYQQVKQKSDWINEK